MSPAFAVHPGSILHTGDKPNSTTPLFWLSQSSAMGFVLEHDVTSHVIGEDEGGVADEEMVTQI